MNRFVKLTQFRNMLLETMLIYF